MAKSKVFKKYEDNSNGFLAVKYKELVDLGLECQIGSKSYQHGQTVYLVENEGDMTKFIQAWESKYGPLITTCKHQKDRSTVRNYKAYSHGSYAVGYPSFAATDAQLLTSPPLPGIGGLVPTVAVQLKSGPSFVGAPIAVIEEGVTLNLPETRVNLKSDF